MKLFKKALTFAVVLILTASSTETANAVEWRTDCGGCGYEECRKAPCIAPAVVLAVIALAAIIAVAAQHHGASHNH